MKVSYFKKIEEGFFSDLARVGSDTVAAARPQDSMSRISKVELQKRYLQDFIEDLLVDLNSAIKGGRVDPKISTSVPAQQQSQATAPAQQQSQATAPAQQQPRSAIQPTAQTRQDAQQRTAQRKQQQKAQTKTAQTKPVDREEELAGVADLGYNEGYHSFLNALVEGYITEQDNMGIATWIMMWFDAYMKGVNWASDKAGIETIAREIEASYSKDRGKAATQKLASRSWDLVKTSNGIPAGANQPKDQDLATQLKNMNADPTQVGTQQNSELESLKQSLGSLSTQELQNIKNILAKKAGVA